MMAGPRGNEGVAEEPSPGFSVVLSFFCSRVSLLQRGVGYSSGVLSAFYCIRSFLDLAACFSALHSGVYIGSHTLPRSCTYAAQRLEEGVCSFLSVCVSLSLVRPKIYLSTGLRRRSAAVILDIMYRVFFSGLQARYIRLAASLSFLRESTVLDRVLASRAHHF